MTSLLTARNSSISDRSWVAMTTAVPDLCNSTNSRSSRQAIRDRRCRSARRPAAIRDGRSAPARSPRAVSRRPRAPPASASMRSPRPTHLRARSEIEAGDRCRGHVNLKFFRLEDPLTRTRFPSLDKLVDDPFGFAEDAKICRPIEMGNSMPRPVRRPQRAFPAPGRDRRRRACRFLVAACRR